MPHSHVWYDSCTRVTWLIHTHDMTHSQIWHVSFTRVIWLIHTCDTTHPVWHDSFVCVPWLSHSYVRHDLTWLIHIYDITHAHVWHDSPIQVLFRNRRLKHWISLERYKISSRQQNLFHKGTRNLGAPNLHHMESQGSAGPLNVFLECALRKSGSLLNWIRTPCSCARIYTNL